MCPRYTARKKCAMEGSGLSRPRTLNLRTAITCACWISLTMSTSTLWTATAHATPQSPLPAELVRDTAAKAQDFKKTPRTETKRASSSNREDKPGNLFQGQHLAQSDSLTQNTSWHAHLHLNQLFNTTADLDGVAYFESEFFIQKIFIKYGTLSALPLDGLESLMTSLGLSSRLEDETMEAGSSQNGTIGDKKGVRKRAVAHVHTDHSSCHSPSELLAAFHFEQLPKLGAKHFLLLCPALLDQLDHAGCHPQHHQHHQNHHRNEHDVDHAHHDGDNSTDVGVTKEKVKSALGKLRDIPPIVWLYSSIAVLIISLVGLLGVAAIPLIRKLFYKSLLQFLVALAIGALSGDALLHLLPHAISSDHAQDTHATETRHADTHNHTGVNSSSHDSGDDHSSGGRSNHRQTVWKGLVALMGLLFFFVAERVLTLVTSFRSKKKAKKSLRLKEDGLTQTKSLGQDGKTDLEVEEPLVYFPLSGASRLATSDSAVSLSIRETAIISDDEDDGNDDSAHQIQERLERQGHGQGHHDSQGHDRDHGHGGQGRGDNRNSHHHHGGLERLQSHRNSHGHSNNNHDHPQGQGQVQGHGHGHSHEVPGSVSAVAWMVIMGDGLHNLSDGLAIGAAFASGITGGISTTIAVFCHELPHEIGDFAMLLSAGMSIRQGIAYNLLSSVLCFLGMVGGVLLGTVGDASPWIFAGVGGMFLYIALADMLPQLSVHDSSSSSKSSPCNRLLVQCVGISIGAGIMLTIALFEEDIKTLLD